MLKRDSLTAQMQQLSQVLAKVKRLIIEDNENEALNVTQDTLYEYYKLSNEDLFHLEDNLFREKIITLHAEEVDMLAYFIDEYAGMQEELELQLTLYQRYLLLIRILEQEYQFVSIDHMARAAILNKAITRTNLDWDILLTDFTSSESSQRLLRETSADLHQYTQLSCREVAQKMLRTSTLYERLLDLAYR